MRNGQAVDFLIEKRGVPVLAVEARNELSPSPAHASEFLRNLLTHGDIPESQYFLLAFRNHLYLWRDPAPPLSLPDFEGETADALAPYLVRLRRPLDKLSQSGFEMLIQSWVGEVVMGILPDAGDRKWLVDSGLAEAVRDGYIRTNIAA
jgi:hypothetical protein